MYLLLFLSVMLVLLWLFQIVFLDDFYREIKISQLKLTAEAISVNIHSDSVIRLMRRFATENQMCISIVDEYGRTYLYADVLPDCVIHKTTTNTTAQIYANAENSDGTYLQIIDRNIFRDDVYDNEDFFGKVPEDDEGLSSIVIYAKIAGTDRGNYAVIINTNISPITSTVNTLRTQLLWITAIMAIVGLAFSWYISTGISKPIMNMTSSAKSLATGNYEANFTGGSYLETKELADALNFAAEELRKVDTLKSELIANVSHDLKTPLTMIKGYSEMMQDFPDEVTTENLQVIIDETEHLTRLVNDILDLSKLQSSNEKLKYEEFNLTESIRNIITRYSALMAKDGYNIVFDYNGDVYVKGDEMRITQVVYNLINNAINYSGEDKTVIITQTEKADTVLIEVTDHGRGIPAKDLGEIWERYYRTDNKNTHTRSVVGTGLGLSIVKSILEKHSASYGAESEEGKGSTFRFEIKKI